MTCSPSSTNSSKCIHDNGAPDYPDIEVGDDGMPV